MNRFPSQPPTRIRRCGRAARLALEDLMKRCLAGLALAALMLGGCTETPEPTVATAAGTPGPTVAGSPSAALRTERLTEAEKGIMYARCMSAKGVEIRDPVDGAMPVVMYKNQAAILGALGDDFYDPVMRDAWLACKHLYPSITYRKVDPAQAQEYRDYALCMREQGMIEGVPIVEADGTIADRNNAATRTGPDPGPSPEYMVAHRKCRKHLSGGQGDPPPLDQQP